MGKTTRRRRKQKRKSQSGWHAGNTWKDYTNGSTTPYDKVCQKQLERRGRLGTFRGHLDKSTMFSRSRARELAARGI